MLSEWLLPTITAFVGLLLGGVGKIFFERYKFLQKRSVLINMLCGEIKATQERCKQVNFEKDLKECAESGKLLLLPAGNIKYIYEDCKQDIGYLPAELAELIPHYYRILLSANLSLNTYCDETTQERALTANQITDVYNDIIDDLLRSQKLAEEIVSVSKKYVNQRFLLIFKVN